MVTQLVLQSTCTREQGVTYHSTAARVPGTPKGDTCLQASGLGSIHSYAGRNKGDVYPHHRVKTAHSLCATLCLRVAHAGHWIQREAEGRGPGSPGPVCCWSGSRSSASPAGPRESGGGGGAWQLQ